MISKCILHHLAKFQIRCFTIILGFFQKSEQGNDNFFNKMRTVRTMFKMAILKLVLMVFILFKKFSSCSKYWHALFQFLEIP